MLRWLPAAFGLWSIVASAQDAGAAAVGAPVVPAVPIAPVVEPTPVAEPLTSRELPTIYVTARKVREALDDVPGSVSTLSGQFMRDSGSTGLQQMQNYASNIQLRLTPATSNFYIRGFGTDSSNAGFEPSVASVVDGIYYGRSNFLAVFFNDLDRLEVLRGPQGTLFGKNSSAGVLNIVTAPPIFAFESVLEMLVDSTGQRVIKPVVNLPVAENLAVRLSANYTDDPGRLMNTALDRREGGPEQATVRVRVRWYPEGDATFDLGAFYSHQEYNNDLFQLSAVGPNMLALMRTYDAQVETDTDNFRGSSNVDGKGVVDFSGANLTWAQDLGNFAGFETLTLSSISGYAEAITQRRDFDADFSPIPAIRDSLVSPSPYRQVSQELRFSGTRDDLLGLGGTFEFVVGGYYFRSTLFASDIFELEDLGATTAYLIAANADSGRIPGGLLGSVLGGTAEPITTLAELLAPLLDPTLGPEQSAIVTLRQRTDANAAYGQAEWIVWGDVALIGGLRVGEEEKTGRATSFSSSRVLPLFADQENHNTKLRRYEREVSPKAGLKWQPSRDLNLFATWSQGFKSGGYNALPLNDDNLEFEPEKASSIEAGIKARVLHGALSIAATLFDTHFKDLQVSTFRGGGFFILNAATAQSRGLELDLHWLPPIDGAALRASLGYVDGRFLKYPDAPAPADSSTNPPLQSLNGRRLPITPKVSATVIPSWTVPVKVLGGSINLGAEYIYKSNRYLDVDLDRRTLQAATHEFGLRTTFAGGTGGWQLTLNAKNLTDETTLDQILDQPLAPGNFEAIRGDRGRYYSAVLTLALH